MIRVYRNNPKGHALRRSWGSARIQQVRLYWRGPLFILVTPRGQR